MQTMQTFPKSLVYSSSWMLVAVLCFRLDSFAGRHPFVSSFSSSFWTALLALPSQVLCC